MRTYIQLRQGNQEALPAALKHDDVRYPDELVRFFLNEFTVPGQVVFDPFAGFGTTLLIADQMGRQGFGLEFDKDRCAYAQSKIANPDNLIHGDARQLSKFSWPPIDFSITSPPFMNKFDHRQNPLTGYSTQDADYAQYLRELQAIYRQLATLIKPAARVVVEASNLKTGGGVTPLAWDIARVVGEVLQFDGEIVACWDTYGYGYDHSYCLLFSPASSGFASVG